MKTYSRHLIALIALVFLLSGISVKAEPADAATKQPIRILYVGSSAKPSDFKPNTISGMLADPERMPDFREFLEKNFVSVKTCEASEFTPALASDADVVIMDARITGGLPPDFRRPVIVMGGTGFFTVERSGTKINWL